MKWKVNKWQFVMDNGVDYARMERGWRWFRIGIINLKMIPEEGHALVGKMYRGLIFRMYYFWPIERIYLD